MALELNDGNVSATARQLNIPRDTLNSWRSGIGITENVLRIQRGVKGPLADQFEQTARLYLEHAQKPEIIEKTSGYYAVIAASDSMKSSQLLRGEPTEIHSMSEQDRQLRLAELLERLQSRAGG
jgi:transposase-like protein